MNPQELPQNLSAKYPEIWLGNRSPLDATWTGEAVNFALFSENAAAVDLCPL
jgi:pullulanase/glycogen debranching enzyme